MSILRHVIVEYVNGSSEGKSAIWGELSTRRIPGPDGAHVKLTLLDGYNNKVVVGFESKDVPEVIRALTEVVDLGDA